MQERTIVTLDRNQIELRAHQTLLIPVVQRAPLAHYTVRLMRAWNDSDIDIAIPTAHLISPEGFSLARVVGPPHRRHCEVEVSNRHGRIRYRFISDHRAPIAALRQRIDALPQRARRLRQARLDLMLAARPTPPSMPLQVDPEVRVDIRRLSRATTSCAINLVFAGAAEPPQILDMFGPIDAWRDGGFSSIRIDVDDTLAGSARYALVWPAGVTTTIVVEIGSRSASNFHQYMMQVAGHDDTASGARQLPIAVQELGRDELELAITRLRNHALSARGEGAFDMVTDEVWRHVLTRRQTPRSLVYPSSAIWRASWDRLCDDAFAMQDLYQFSNDWFLRHALPRLALGSLNQIFDSTGQDPRAYRQTVPPMLRQLEVPFAGLDHAQVMQACRSLRNAWLTSSAVRLVPALQRHRLLRSSACRQALADRGSVVIDWLLPEPDMGAATTAAHPAWNAVIGRAMATPPPQHERMTGYQQFMRLRHVLASSYPDYLQLQLAELKRLLRGAGVYHSLHALALVEFERDDTDRLLPPLRVCFVETLLQDGLPDDLSPQADLYLMHAQAGALAWQAAALTRSSLEQMLMQAAADARQRHHTAVARYWSRYDDAQSGGDDTHAMILSAQACLAAHDLCNAGHLSATGLRLIIAAAGFGTPGTGEARTHLLDLGGVISIDLVTIRGDDGTVILYRPGQWPLFQQYPDMSAMRLALAEECANDVACRQWASHFDPAARPDSFKAGIDSLLSGLGCGEAVARVALAEARVRVEGDVFHQVARRQQQAATTAATETHAMSASPWSDAERFFDDDLDLSTYPASGAWLDALMAASDRHAPGRSTWERDSHIVTMPLTGVLALSSELQQELLQTACRQEREQALWHQRAPDIGIDGARYMHDFLRRTFADRFTGDALDVDQLLLNEYYPPQSHVAFYMFNDIDLLRRRKTSIPLSQLSYRNIDVVNVWESLINGGERYFTVSHRDTSPQYYDEQFDNVVDPEALVRALIDSGEFDFVAHHQQQIIRYFTDHATTLARLARERAQLTAQLMVHEGQLSADDYRLAASAFGTTADLRDDVLAYPLRVGGHAARDCLHLHCTASGRRLLYLAGDDMPYLGFDNLQAARQFLLDLGRDRPRLLDFAQTHFAQEDAHDRRAPGGLRLTLVPGVISVLQSVDQASMLNANPQLARERPKTRHDALMRRRSQERLHGLLAARSPIAGDPFMALVTISQQGAMADAAYFIRSASDRAKEEWMEYARIVPVDFVDGVVRLALGKTADDLRAARLSLGIDLILNLIPAPTFSPKSISLRRTANPVIAIAGSRSAHALARSATGNEPVARLARWFKPPQRINGKIGYVLSPSRAHLWHRAEHKLISTLLDSRAFNATVQDARAILHTPSPPSSPRWYTVATQAIRLDRAATRFFNQLTPPARHYLRELADVDDLFELAYRSAPVHGYAALGRGLVVGENHATTAARRFINDNLERLSNCGVRLLYTEVFKRDADNELLRIFNAGGDFPDHVLRRLNNLDRNAMPRSGAEFSDGQPSASLLRLFENARRHGLEVRAVDNVPAAAADYLHQPFTSPHPRTSSMNYVAYQVIRHDQAHFRGQAWVAHVGAGHAVRDHGIPGLNEITAAPSVFVHSGNDATPLTLGDYHLAVDGITAIPRLQPPA
ncbi:membrane-targeted effector domain-containing toxin [Herbaspirillum sp. alder98]|uniref:membrane-targeted effector domain-containing toxin n=1 Tax=Herbaspirillum sp. alder98 TaxID=2913096 RepID=UPI001CD87CD3|nr:membrane-targeted effector domain-containing toxin [Herbaspirillum sp. alder98]MCA1325286.1 membrane-targeted effector domain-containing toxin [Herbaspirillum sp. alder98]